MFFKLLHVVVFLISFFVGISAEALVNIDKPTHLSTPKLSCDDIKYIIDFHNNCRRKLANGTLEGQPKADNMQTMVWDEELAEVAANYTKQMVFAHNPGRNIDRFSVGENLFMSGLSNRKNTKIEWRRPLNAWFNEYKLYTFQPAVDDPPTAHYTQFIWADSVYLGCAVTLFLDSRNWIYKYYVCNYGPSGNWYGSFPYIEGYGDIFEELLRNGELPPGFELPFSPNDLLCDLNQCNSLYGPNCPM